MNEDYCELIVNALDDLKASDIKVLDVRQLTSITDIMIIASGRSSRHVSSLADKVIETAKEHTMEILGTEGQQQGDWVLIDLGHIIVHVMQPSTRDYYQLEKLWSNESPGMQAKTN